MTDTLLEVQDLTVDFHTHGGTVEAVRGVKAALRAFNDAIRHSSIILFRSLGLDHSVMNVKVTIGVQDPGAS